MNKHTKSSAAQEKIITVHPTPHIAIQGPVSYVAERLRAQGYSMDLLAGSGEGEGV